MMPKPFPHLLVLGVLLWMMPLAIAQSKKPPRFEDYPVTEIYRGSLATPKITKGIRLRISVEIRESYSSEKSPNFAGRFVITDWACGSPCRSFVMVDAKTGNIYHPPIAYKGDDFYLPNLSYSYAAWGNAETDFKLNSRLFVIKCDEGENRKPYTFYFLWDHNRWILLRKISLPKMKDQELPD